ncbi:MAG: hypothetical protein AAF617_11325, partial [Bacteroidota bacterium]
MAVNIQRIQFKHLLHDESDKAAKSVKVQIQFYNVNTKSWLPLTDAVTITKGQLAHTVTIPSRISTKNQTIRVVREVLKSGGTPSFRIIKANTQSPTEVIATTFIALIGSETELTIDFGKSWLLNSKEYVIKDDYIVIASQVPMFQLTSAIRTMEIEKDNAVAQVAGLNTTIASLSDTQTALQTQLTSAQNDLETQNQQVADLSSNLQTITANLANEQELRQSLETQLAEQSAQMEAMEVSTGDVSAVMIERDNALAQVSGLNETISSLSDERAVLQDQLANAQNDMETQTQEVASLNTNLQAVTADLSNERELRASLEAEKANLETQLSEQRDQIEAIEVVNVGNSNLQEQVADITTQRDDLLQQVSAITVTNNNLQQEVSNLTIERDNLELEKVSFLASISQLQASVQQEKDTIKVKDAEIKAKQDRIKDLEKDNSKLQQDLAEAQDFSVTDHPNKLSENKVYSSILKYVIKADEERRNSKYKLSNNSLNI